MATPGLSEQQIAQVKAMLAAAGSKPPPPPEWITGLNAVADFIAKAAWPVIIALLIWRLYPVIVAIAKSRAFTIKVGSMEVSVQDATQELAEQIKDLQGQVMALRSGGAAPAKATKKPVAPPEPPPPVSTGRRILWVDDVPSNNAFQIAQLEDAGVTVVKSLATADAMRILSRSAPFAAVISDMGRREDGAWQRDAGLALLREMRADGRKEPFIIYSSRAQAAQADAQVRAADGDGATSSPIALMEWVRSKLPAK
jgi:CheY-like chemotaxis protein